MEYYSNDNDINSSINIGDNCFAYIDLDNTFIIFKSINNILYLIYSSINKSIICYDLNNFKKINEIKNKDKEYITNFRHYFERKSKRDIVMGISWQNNGLKLWNAYNWECILNIKKVNNNGHLLSSCFLTS